MSWNYRAVRRIFDYDGHEEIGIYSVYYDDEGQVRAMSVLPEKVNSDSLEDVEWVLEKMKECLQKPILDYSDAPLTPENFMHAKIENAELVNGTIIELPHRTLAEGALLVIIGDALRKFVDSNQSGQVAAGGSFITGEKNVRVPAVSFLSNQDLIGEKTDELIRKAPTLAVEIISQNDVYGDVDDKAAEFLRAGSRAVWIVNPHRRTVAVHTPDNVAITYGVGHAIPGGEILPGFDLPVADIFED